MEIKIYSLFSGSSGNCTWFKIGDLQFLVDAGGSCKAINDALGTLGSSLDKISHIFVTHEHSDHIKGIPVICRRHKPTLHIHKASFKSSATLCGAIDPMLVDFFDTEGEPIRLCENVSVSAFKTPHDSHHSCAYVVDCAGRRFAVATDMGYITKGAAEMLTGVDALILESNYDKRMLQNGPYPDYLKSRIASDRGHLDNKVCAKFAAHLAKNGTKTVVLGHLSNENNAPKTALSELEAEFLCQNIPYIKDVETEGTLVENSVEIVEKSINKPAENSTFTVKTENFAVEEEKQGVEKVEKTVEKSPKLTLLGDLAVENPTKVNTFGKNTPLVEKNTENAEKIQKIRIAVASRYTPTMIFEGEI